MRNNKNQPGSGKTNASQNPSNTVKGNQKTESPDGSGRKDRTGSEKSPLQTHSGSTSDWSEESRLSQGDESQMKGDIRTTEIGRMPMGAESEESYLDDFDHDDPYEGK